LKFYRLAFGAAGGGDVALPLSEAREAARGLLSSGKVALEWPDAAMPQGAPPKKVAVRLLLNLIQLAAEALPRGGRVAVQLARGASGVSLTVSATGTAAAMHDIQQGALAGRLGLDALDPRAAQAYYARRLATECGAEVGVVQAEGQVVLS